APPSSAAAHSRRMHRIHRPPARDRRRHSGDFYRRSAANGLRLLGGDAAPDQHSLRQRHAYGVCAEQKARRRANDSRGRQRSQSSRSRKLEQDDPQGGGGAQPRSRAAGGDGRRSLPLWTDGFAARRCDRARRCLLGFRLDTNRSFPARQSRRFYQIHLRGDKKHFMSRVYEALKKASETKKQADPRDSMPSAANGRSAEAAAVEAIVPVGTNGHALPPNGLPIMNGDAKSWRQWLEEMVFGWDLRRYKRYPIVSLEKDSAAAEQYKILREQLKHLRNGS